MSENKDKKEHSGLVDSTIGASTTENVERFGRAASQYIKGYKGEADKDGRILKKGLKQVSDSKVNPEFKYQNIKQQSGFSAEIHYVDKENAESIIEKSDRKIYRSNDLGRGNDRQLDVLSIGEQGNPTWGAQMKFCGKFSTKEEIQNSAKNVVNKLAGDKWERYRGTKVLVPSEQYSEAKNYAENTARKLQEQAEKFRNEGNTEKAQLLESKATAYKQVSLDLEDSGITSKEAIFIREHPKLATAKYVAKTAHRSGIENAKSAAVLSGSISLAQNIVCVIRDDKDIDKALVDVGKDTAAGAVSAYIIGAGDTAIRSVMSSSANEVFVNLSKSNMPSMIATAAVQITKSLIRYANGEINSLELVEELGEKGTGMVAASFGAAVGTAILPGVGTVIGGMVGYMTSSAIYGSCMTVLKEERISADSREKIHCIANAAIESMKQQGQELLDKISTFYHNREQVFSDSIKKLEMSGETNDLTAFTESLNNIAVEMGQALHFKNFEEFDSFMSDSDTTFKF